MVTLAEERLASAAARRLRRRATAAADRDASPRSRRSCAAPARLQDDGREGAWQRFVLDFRSERGDPELRQRRGARALQPGRRRDARPHHPHQELAADRAGAGSRQARRLQGGRAGGGRGLRRRLPRLFRAPTTRASAAPRSELDPLPRVVLVPGLGLFGLGRSDEGRARSPPISPRAAVETITDAEAIGRFESISEADMFDMEYWSLEQAKLGSRSREAARRPDRGGHRRRPAPSARRPRRPSRRPAPRSRCSTSTEAAPSRRKAIGGARSRCAATSPTPASVRAAFDQVVEAFGGVDIVVSNAGARLAGPHRRGRRGDAARELRAQFLRPPARRAERGAHHAGAGHRRLPAVQRLEAGGQSRARISAPTACPRPRRCS